MKKLYFLLLFLVVPFLLAAQTALTPDGRVPQCPGNRIAYTAFPAGGSASANYAGCSFKWSITNGKFYFTNSSDDYTTSNSSVEVIWNDVTNKGELKVTITS